MKYIDDLFLDKIAKHGRPLVTNLSILLKMAGIYKAKNEAVVNSAARVMKELEELLGEDGEITLKMTDESFFIEDVRIRASLNDLDNFSVLTREMNSRGIGALTFKAPLQHDDLIALAYAIKEGGDAAEIQSGLESRMKKGVSVGGPVFSQRENSIDFKDKRATAKRAYLRTIAAYSDVLGAIRSGRKPDIRKVKRAIQSLVDGYFKDETFVLGLTTLRNEESYNVQHPVNVAVFSIGIGEKLGFKRYSLGLLGMAALFHDIGMLEIPTRILNKKGEFSPAEMELIKMHPVEGVKNILRTRGINDVSILSMVVALEHHLAQDGSGYPGGFADRSPLIFSRIVKIADDFDSLNSGMVYSRKALTPERALAVMHLDSNYDPRLFRAFFEIFKRRNFSF